MERDRHNPFVAQCEAHGWFLAEQARELGIPVNALHALHAGLALELKERYRAPIEAGGFDFDALRAAYCAWREHQALTGVLPARLKLEALPELDQAIVQALRAGIRGETAIARAANVTRREVVQFLRRGVPAEAITG